MKVAVINEVSAVHSNSDIIAALEATGQDVINVGMSGPDEKPALLYTHTGFMAAVVLNLGIADFVVGGCGTGQGFLGSVMQYPGVVCGHILSPLDAWLFAQINAGNCVSFALNQGYGWAADVNLRFTFERLFGVESGSGYPDHRKKPQREARDTLERISESTHRPFAEILERLPREIVEPSLLHPPLRKEIEKASIEDEAVRAFIEELYGSK